jgi:GT2 family glycosyltransferase
MPSNDTPSVPEPFAKAGVVAIGRNEGNRLKACIQSVTGTSALVVYVDSGSIDGSIDLAKSAGVDVVALDMNTPFTAARARNEGFTRLRQLAPQLPYVQFVDGDCEIDQLWINAAVAFLDDHPDVAVVCGRRRERFPDRSIYNKFCDIEWDTPIGKVSGCGGDAMIRADAFERVGGYRADLIAGEEPELCLRLRAAGSLIWRLDQEMTIHDADMTHFRQWWRRMIRSGYAFAQSSYLHGKTPERFCVWESRRAWLWGLWIPLTCAALILLCGKWGLLALMIYPLQVCRRLSRVSGGMYDRLLIVVFELLGRFPEMVGQADFMRDRLLGRAGKIIEYK